MANQGDISFGLVIGAGQSVRRNAGDSAFEAYTPSGGVPTTITVANEAADTTCFPLFATAATGDLGPKSNAGLIFNSSTADLGTKILSLGTAGATTGALKMSGSTSGTVTLQTAAAAGTYTLTLPTTDGAASEFLQTDGSGNLTWAAAGGGFSWGTSVSSGSGTGLAMTTADLAGDKPFITMAHTASGTLTSNTTTQFSISSSRTATGGTPSDNFAVASFSRTNITNGANLTAAGSIVSITATDTQTANTLTPTYDYLSITTTARNTGRGVYVNLGSVSTAAITGIFVSGGSGVSKSVSIINNYDFLGASGLLEVSSTKSGTSSNQSNTPINIFTTRTLNNLTNDSFTTVAIARTTTMASGSGTSAGAIVSITNTTGASVTDTTNLLSLNPSTLSTGSSIKLTVANSTSAPTNGHIYSVLGNTQSAAHTMQKIDTGTSSQGHIGLLINSYNASASARGIKIDPSTTSTGYGIEFANVGADNFRGIYFGTINATNSTSKYGIWQNLIVNGGNASTNGYGIYQDTVINANAGTGYGLYQGIIAGSSTGTGYGWRVGQLVAGAATVEPTKSQYFSFNNAQSANLAARTVNTAEWLFSRTNTRTSTTVADNFSLLHMQRTNIQNGAGGTLTATGSVLHLENVATQTAGTLTDSVPLLKLTQDNDSIGGHILFTAYSGTPTANNTLWYDGTNIKYINNAGVTKTVTVT